jgi:hypothetical protein
LNAVGEDDLSLMRMFCRGIKACDVRAALLSGSSAA